MEENQCMKCRNVIKDKERDVVQTCTISATLNNQSLIVLGIKGVCPYHEYPEYYWMK
ncbi:TPA: hypothetical protein ACF2DE_002856 [Clostridium perfringens]